MIDLLKCEQVSYQYPGMIVHALSDVSFSIGQGRTTAILGPNGAGKSTLIDMLLNWRRPTSGSITYQGSPLQSFNRREWGCIASLVPQNELLQFSFRLIDYVLFGRAPHVPQLSIPSDHDREIALQALSRVGLAHLAARSVLTLSGGERQLLFLARSLAQQPSILILDEPTSSLDPANRSKVLHILEELHRDGLTIIFSTHDPNLATRLADHVIMIREGRIMCDASAEIALDWKRLSELYGISMQVMSTPEGRLIVYEYHD